MVERNEAMRLADDWEPRSYEVSSMLRQQAERIAELEAERDQHKHTATSLIALLADIRKACGDNGKRMQPELVEFIGSLTTERDQLRAEVELYREFFDADRLVNKIMDEVSPGLTSPKGPEYAARVDAAINRRCAAVTAIDRARTTHKDEG